MFITGVNHVSSHWSLITGISAKTTRFTFTAVHFTQKKLFSNLWQGISRTNEQAEKPSCIQ